MSWLIDPSLSLRCSQDGSGGGAIGSAPPGHKFLLKWSVPLGLVDVVEFGSSEDVPDTGRHPVAQHHSGEKVVINAKPSMTLNHIPPPVPVPKPHQQICVSIWQPVSWCCSVFHSSFPT